MNTFFPPGYISQPSICMNPILIKTLVLIIPLITEKYFPVLKFDWESLEKLLKFNSIKFQHKLLNEEKSVPRQKEILPAITDVRHNQGKKIPIPIFFFQKHENISVSKMLTNTFPNLSSFKE